MSEDAVISLKIPGSPDSVADALTRSSWPYATVIGKARLPWREVLLDLKSLGLKIDPQLAIGDGALVGHSLCL
jgi:hypothetical protein